MARKPSFDFERRERDKAKLAKRAEKTKTKNEKKTCTVETPSTQTTGLESD